MYLSFYFFVLFLSFCLLKSPHGLSNSQLSVTVKFSSSLIDVIQFLNRIFEFSSQTINKKNHGLDADYESTGTM